MPLVAEIDPIARTLRNILVGEALNHGALTVVPLLGPTLSEPRWLTLAVPSSPSASIRPVSSSKP